MVSLAKRLEGRPFHLIASFCQRGERDTTVAYIKSKGLEANTPNLTVTYQGRHAGIKGNGYVPYYAVFDHRGNLAHHHMCGQWHGGDGLKMIEWVDKLLEDAPGIYLGDEPYEKIAAIAKQVSKKKSLAGAVKKLDKGMASEDTDAETKTEMKRLYDALTAWRDGAMKRAVDAMATEPSDVVVRLTQLSRDFKGSSLGADVDERLRTIKASKELKTSIAIAKKRDKILKGLAKLKPCKSCKRKGSSAARKACAACRKENAKAFERAEKKWKALIEEAADLPIQATLEKVLPRIQGKK